MRPNQIVLAGIHLISLLGLGAANSAHAEDLNFRYKEGKCLNDTNQVGYNPGVLIQCGDLRGKSLRLADLSKKDLRGSNFDKVDLNSAILTDANFEGASLRGAILAETQYDRVNFTHPDLTGTDLRGYRKHSGGIFIGAKLTQARLDYNTFNGFDFSQAQLQGTSWVNVLIEGSKFDKADLTSASFEYTTIEQISFKSSILKSTTLQNIAAIGVDFSASTATSAIITECSFKETNFSEVILKGAQLSNTFISRSSFAGNNFQDVKFNQVRFPDCDFSKANLSGVVLDGVDANGGNFTGANLDGTHMSHGQFGKAKFIGASLKGANLETTVFSGAVFTQADLTGAKVSGIDLSFIDFTKATLNSAVFTKVNLSGAHLEMVMADGAKFSYALARKASFKKGSFIKVEFQGLHGEEADFSDAILTEANLKSVFMVGTVVDRTVLTKAVFNKVSVLPMTKDEALQKGMIFKGGASTMLILWDSNSGNGATQFDALIKELAKEGIVATLASKPDFEFDGTAIATTKYDAILQTAGTTYSQDIPQAGQLALVKYVQEGGIFIYNEWNTYRFKNGLLNSMRELILFDQSNTNGSSVNTISIVPEQKDNPVLEGISASFMITCSHNQGGNHVFDKNPVTTLLKDGSNAIMIKLYRNILANAP